jgi:hypothetical protein
MTQQSSAGNAEAIIEEAMWMLQDVPGNTLVERIARLTKWYQDLCSNASAQASPDEMTAAALVRVAKANSSDPETDDLTIPLAIELSETQRRLYYMEEKYGKIDWGVSLPSTDGGGK